MASCLFISFFLWLNASHYLVFGASREISLLTKITVMSASPASFDENTLSSVE
jgi:hypothetical protein